MPNNKKLVIVQELIRKIRSAKTVALVDYQGLTTKQLEELRGKIQDSKGNFQIVKNTLLEQALSALHLKPEEQNKKPLGPTALIFSNDENSALKIAQNFSSDSTKPQLKFGFLDKTFLDKTSLKNLARLPDKQTLLSQLLRCLKSPINNVVFDLTANQHKLLFVLSNIKKEVL